MFFGGGGFLFFVSFVVVFSILEGGLKGGMNSDKLKLLSAD